MQALVPALASLALLASGAQDTAVRVSPGSGGRATTFTAGFTLRVDAGHVGVASTSYRVVTERLHADRASCRPGPVVIASGHAGERRHVALRPPRGGWCRGHYRVTVYGQSGPYCPPPQDGQIAMCPKFATREVDTGSARFAVR